MNCIVRDKTVQTEANAMLAILRILVQCDASTAWMVKRTVECALLLADVVDKTSAAVATTDGDQCKRHLSKLVKEIQHKCGAAIHQDLALVDSLQTARTGVHHADRTKAEVALILLGESVQATASARSDAVHSGSRSVSALFKFGPARPQSTESAASTNLPLASDEYEHLVDVPSEEQLATGLKAVRSLVCLFTLVCSTTQCLMRPCVFVQIQRLRTSARGGSEVSGLRVIELLLQLKQQAKYSLTDPTAAAASSSSRASVSVLLSTDSTPEGNNSSGSCGLLPATMVRGCKEIVDLACELYIKEGQLSWNPRADLLQVRMIW